MEDMALCGCTRSPEVKWSPQIPSPAACLTPRQTLHASLPPRGMGLVDGPSFAEVETITEVSGNENSARWMWFFVERLYF